MSKFLGPDSQDYHHPFWIWQTIVYAQRWTQNGLIILWLLKDWKRRVWDGSLQVRAVRFRVVWMLLVDLKQPERRRGWLLCLAVWDGRKYCNISGLASQWKLGMFKVSCLVGLRLSSLFSALVFASCMPLSSRSCFRSTGIIMNLAIHMNCYFGNIVPD